MANVVNWGFRNLLNVMDQRVAQVGASVVWGAVTASVAEHNRQIESLLGLFCARTTDYMQRYITPGNARLQPLTEDGRPLPIRGGASYDVAFPLLMGGTAWGANYVTRQKMTVAEAQAATNALISADARWLRDHILAALFANTSWTWTDPLHGSITVKGLANADTDVYSVLRGADAPATDNHYAASASAIADVTNPYPTIWTELTEHPDNGGEVVALVPSALIATTEALTTFVPISDANVQVGANSDVLVGQLGVAVPGMVRGYVDRVWIVEWPTLPADMIVAMMTEGERPLAMRQDPEPELQGFRQVGEYDDYPFSQAQFIRRAGFGAHNRVGAVCYRIGNASYAVPTGFTSPMP